MRTVVALTSITLLTSVHVSHAQAPPECAEKFRLAQQQVSASATFEAARGIQRAKRCVAAGKCKESEVHVSLQEFMLDDEIVRIKREKLRVLRDAMRQFDAIGNDACKLAELMPQAMAPIERLNVEEMNRLLELAEQRYGTFPSDSSEGRKAQ